MNPKVEKFLSEMKESKANEAKRRRDEHLISLGLVDESKRIESRKYSKHWTERYNHYDREKNMYYYETEENSPLDITDEEYEEILKYAPLDSEKTVIEYNETKSLWAGVIKIMAYVYLIGGILLNLFLILSIDKQGLVINDSEIKLAADVKKEYFVNIVFIVISFPFIMGLSKVVAAAEKYLHK
ncbi:MAG: hypothetical protein IIW77_04085 [Bacteroidaceae bacterium]|nr:hypothetical protein [Bacteroidaceae bacterium]